MVFTAFARLLVFFALIFSLNAVAEEFVVPPLRAPVNDVADLLSSHTEQALDSALRQVQRQGGTQISVLTLPNLAGLSIEQASIRVVDQWKLGTAENDNGVLFLIAKQERRVRIEVGQGLEGSLTDAHSKRIIDQRVTPLFREGDFDAGTLVGIVGIVERTNPELDVAKLFSAADVREKKPAREGTLGSIFKILFIVLFLLFAMGRRFFLLGALIGGSRHSGFGGGGFSGGGGGFSGGGGGFSGGGASGGW